MGSRPLGITIIAIILAFGGVSQLLVGTEVLGITSFGLGAVGGASNTLGWASIVSGILTIVVAGGLFTLAGWAWWLTVIVMVARLVADGIVLFTHGMSSTLGAAALGGVVVSLFVLWYFNRRTVRSAFGQ